MVQNRKKLQPTSHTPKPGFGARPTGEYIFERQNHAATLEFISVRATFQHPR